MENNISNLLPQFILKISQYSKAFGLSNFSFKDLRGDVIFIFFIFAILLSTYVSIVLIQFFPYFEIIFSNFDLNNHLILKPAIFLILLILSFLFLSRSPLQNIAFVIRGENSWFQILILSIFICGIIVGFSINNLLEIKTIKLSQITLRIFGSQESLFWWLVLPIFYIALLRKK